MDRNLMLLAVKGVLLEESSSPSVELVHFLANRVHSSIPRQQIFDRFAPIVREAFDQFINDRIDDRLRMRGDSTGHSPFAYHTSSDQEFEEYFVVNVS